MTDEAKRFRVVVVGVASGQALSAQELVGSISQTYPLRPDARLALEAGRSAVVQVADSEYLARRAATKLIKLGAEIRIEPEDGGPGLMDYDSVDLGGGGAGQIDLAPSGGAGGGHFGEESPMLPPPGQSPAPGMLVDMPPTDDAPPATPTRRLTTPAPTVDPEPVPTEAGVPEQAEAREESDPPLEDATTEGSQSMLVRCPAHGLLYDATDAAGCSRCLGPSAEQPFRLAPGLRKRPRLWLTLGLGLGLLLGAVPAALYASSVKSGSLYERRIEAEAVRRARAGSDNYTHEYAKALKKVDTLRSRGVAVSALIWIGISALLMLLWYRFV